MKLLICIPTLDYMPYQFVESLTQLVKQLGDEGIDYDVCFKSGTLVYVARDLLANKAIEEGYTATLWIDADMVFREDILDDLMFCEKPYVCGVFHTRRPPHCSCIFTSLEPIMRIEDAAYSEQANGAAFRIAGSGFGCVYIETKVLKAVKDKFGTCFLPMADLGEDLAFCKRVTECGFEMYCEPTAVVGHVGHAVIYPQDEHKWISVNTGFRNA